MRLGGFTPPPCLTKLCRPASLFALSRPFCLDNFILTYEYFFGVCKCQLHVNSHKLEPNLIACHTQTHRLFGHNVSGEEMPAAVTLCGGHSASRQLASARTLDPTIRKNTAARPCWQAGNGSLGKLPVKSQDLPGEETQRGSPRTRRRPILLVRHRSIYKEIYKYISMNNFSVDFSLTAQLISGCLEMESQWKQEKCREILQLEISKTVHI